ncbi:glycosyltransferase family 2 protein [Flavobacterium flavipallidum]|uniref:Glycosyltransferase n=1 Tax=Flavobacterium flavipallidum TaxID=3139140 RepID=A0ABU9HJ55_9FLAO
MQASILIVSRDRKSELEKTLLLLERMIDTSIHEVLVFLDGFTDESTQLKNELNWVKWHESYKSIGASGARAILYPKATGQILIGLDDDAHPLNSDFISLSEQLFNQYPNVGVLAFQEIKGIFNSEDEALAQKEKGVVNYLCSEFVGCGFAIRKSVYDLTRGFPVWIDIYGEESCVSMEVLANGYDILYTNYIAVNHRVNKEERFKTGRNYFRFGKQLKNTAFYYLVYYPFPFYKICRLLGHNFKKYAFKDWNYFIAFFSSVFTIIINLTKVLKYRNPIDSKVLKKIRQLPNPKY